MCIRDRQWIGDIGEEWCCKPGSRRWAEEEEEPNPRRCLCRLVLGFTARQINTVLHSALSVAEGQRLATLIGKQAVLQNVESGVGGRA